MRRDRREKRRGRRSLRRRQRRRRKKRRRRDRQRKIESQIRERGSRLQEVGRGDWIIPKIQGFQVSGIGGAVE